MPPRHIAVLGGGLTGLSAAYNLSRRFPSSLISVYEGSQRFGGWVRSSRVNVRSQDGRQANILLEAGPRTLRPNSDAVLELVHLLGLSSSLLLTPKASPAAAHRFIYRPPSNDDSLPSGLIQLPSSLRSLVGSPIGRKLLLPAVLQEPFRAKSPSRDLQAEALDDESFDSFVTRHFGSTFAHTMASALIHGIYAADSRNLSVRAAFPSLWDAEKKGNGSVVRGMIRNMITSSTQSLGRHELGSVKERMQGVSVFSFQDGLEEITQALLVHLEHRPNVELFTGTRLESLDVDPDTGDFKLMLSNKIGVPDDSISHIVSALPIPTLKRIMENSSVSLPLPISKASSVSVLNLVFPPSPQPIHPPGFGYLIPRPLQDYDAASLGILGVVFDSCSLAAQDEGEPGFTKMTVMLGGPYASSTRHAPLEHILRELGTHLGAPLPEPVHVARHEHLDCIPVPSPGHLDRVRTLQQALQERLGGRLEIIGAGIGGVSVGDCVRQGREAGRQWT